MRLCQKCETEKPLDMFYADRPNGRKATICAECHSAKSKQHYLDNREKIVARRRERYTPVTALTERKRAERAASLERECNKCGALCKREDLAKGGRRGPRAICKPCWNESIKNYRLSNTEDRRLVDRAARLRQNERLRRGHMLKRYGLTIAEHDVMHEKQRGLCACCGNPERTKESRTGKIRRLSIDHCHATGKVRGLLCGKCNTALGLLSDDRNKILALLDYVDRIVLPTKESKAA